MRTLRRCLVGGLLLLAAGARAQDRGQQAEAHDAGGEHHVTCGMGAALPAPATPRWTTLGAARDGLRALPEVSEELAGCVYGAIVRGIWHVNGGTAANGGTISGLDPQEAYDALRAAGVADTTIQFVEGVWDGAGKRIVGGSKGGVSDFKRIKDAVVEQWVREGKSVPIKTGVVTATRGAAEQASALRTLAAKLNKGETVEVDLAFGSDTQGHFAFLLEVVEYGGHVGFVLADDRTQGDGVKNTQRRGPFFIHKDTGMCFYLDAADGSERECPHNYWVRGALVERK